MSSSIIAPAQPSARGSKSFPRRRRSTCADCGKRCLVQQHHEPPRCEGGTATIPLCRPCHVERHCRANDWARRGRKGGVATARNPLNWYRNLKQYRSINWSAEYVL